MDTEKDTLCPAELVLELLSRNEYAGFNKSEIFNFIKRNHPDYWTMNKLEKLLDDMDTNKPIYFSISSKKYYYLTHS